MKRTPLIAAIVFLWTGCSTAPEDDGGDQAGIAEAETAAPATEIMYLGSRETPIPDVLPDGVAALQPTRAFRALDLLVRGADGDPTLEFQLVGPDGRPGPWQPLTVPVDEDHQAHALINLDTPAMAIRLRGAEGLAFARAEFFERPFVDGNEGHNDDFTGAESHDDADAIIDKAAIAGRWAIPASVNAVGDRQNVRYTGAPSWSGGRNCSGGQKEGTRELGRYLVANFAGAASFEGYACRQIVGSSGMSVHGTGRALDLFVPMYNGQADNDLGDPIAHWLIEHAEEIGIQLIIWDRSIWSVARATRHRAYSGAHPHNDHLHIELTPEAGAKRTRFFTGGAQPPPDAPAPSARRGCSSATLGRTVPHGECVQVNYDHARSGCRACNTARCEDGTWTYCSAEACSATTPHAECAPPPQPDPEPEPAPAPAEPPAAQGCASATLGRSVPEGTFVQVAFDSPAACGACGWSQCVDGGWECAASAEAEAGDNFPHASCAATCYSRTLGRRVGVGGRVQMAYGACANGRTCNWAACGADGVWRCTNEPGDPDYPHARCR